MKILAFVETTVKDRHGKVISHHKARSRSFVRAFNHMICAQCRGQSTPNPGITTKDTGGTNRSLRTSGYGMVCTGGAGVTTYGTRVGTSAQAVDIEDYQLIAAIAHGVGAGQLSHGACTVAYVGVVGSASTFTVSRTFTNGSGGPISVRETGIYNRFTQVGATLIYLMSCRDNITEDVPDAGNLTVTYTIRIEA